MSTGLISDRRPVTGATSVAEVLQAQAERQPDALAYRFLTGIDGSSESWTYRELDLRAQQVANRLRAENLRNKTVLVLHPPGLDYIASFLGCLVAGAIAVPAYPPDTMRFGQTVPRLAAIARDCRATHALTTDEVKEFAENRRAELRESGLGDLVFLGPTDIDRSQPAVTAQTVGRPDSLAFLQYTSGSTSTPKGVMVSNANLIANLRAIHERLGHDEDSAMALWLPPYHDMGLIGGILNALHGGIPLHFMAPMTFVQRPLLWLETIAATCATTAIAPNFGYEQCLRRVTPTQRDRLDLSGWRLALNGAEPVRADTMERFADFFAPSGFDRRALTPCYGLAEATLLVTGALPERRPRVGTFDSAVLEERVARPALPDSPRATRVVSCGPVAEGVEVAVVDPDTRRALPDGRIGEIWTAGPSVARGYWRRPDATRDTFQARLDPRSGTRYLRTGDLGFLRDGELYVTGRTKDVVVVQGRNYFPHDIELTVEKADDRFRPNAGAAFGIVLDDTEHLVVAYEVDSRAVADDPASMLAKLRAAIQLEHEVAPHAVLLLKRGAVHRTTSGKVQRAACRQDLMALGLPVIAASVVRAEPTVDPGEVGPLKPEGSELAAHVVADVLAGGRVDQAEPSTSLADLGVDYAQLLSAVEKLERRFGSRIPVGELLARPRVGTLLALLDGDGPPPAGGGPAPVPPPSGTPGSAVTPKTPLVVPYREGAEGLVRWLSERIADRLGLPAAQIEPTEPFAALGLDSKQLIATCEELSEHLGCEVSPRLAYDHVSPMGLARAIVAEPGVRHDRPLGGPTLSGARDMCTAIGAGPEGGQRAGSGTAEPIAVVGIGCRFPGAPDVESFRRLLFDGRSAVSEVPPERWDSRRIEAPGHGGFLDRIEEFDARFFGISAREAARMDPQQRLLLETAWQALEDAGIAPESLAGSDAGVFVGISSHDYYELQMRDLDAVDVHAATGNAQSVAANRLSYTLDLTGPSLAVDTACSSSLVAVHTACHSLRTGECRTALAGGVNLMLTPALSVAFGNGGMLSDSGSCRTFDDTADGYVRGEGVGLVCLKPLSAALADGDRIHAVIRGSAIGHGGRANGLTAPRSSAQHSVIERALEEARLPGAAVDYVEAHGTGTELGDPIEWDALARAYGRDPATGRPCLVGSAKTNIGHLEAAAGIAGLIKAALVVRDREVPPSLHFEKPNRRLSWEGSGLEVPTVRRALPEDAIVRAAVSSFGFGGTNAHAVLESPPRPARAPGTAAPAPVRPVHALCLSGRSDSSLAALARAYRTHLAAHTEVSLVDLCHSANTGRTHLAHRAVLTAADRQSLDQQLAAVVSGEASAAVARGRVVRGTPGPRIAFLFSGQGSQYPGMGRELYDSHPAVARSLRRSDEVLRPLLGIPLDELLFVPEGAERLQRTRYCQPALVALEIALAELWKSAGVQPAAVLGHSVGAFAAAHVAGAIGLEDALRLTVARAAAMDAQPGDGAMVACAGDPEAIREVAAAYPSLSLAAVNSAEHLVLSGPAQDVERAAEYLRTRSVAMRPLKVSHAFHSAQMAGAVTALSDAAGACAVTEPEIPWVSDLTGRPNGRVEPGYWADHLTGTVRFADGLGTLRELGCDGFVEVGPHPVLLSFVRATAPEDRATTELRLATAHRQAGDWETFLRSVGRLHCAGGAVDWAALDRPYAPDRVPVPHTVFERQPYWWDVAMRKQLEPAAGEPLATEQQAGRDGGIPYHDHPAAHPEQQADEQGLGSAVTTQSTSQAERPSGAEPVPMARADVLGYVQQVSGFAAEEIPLDARLGADLGCDSLMKTELERRIAAKYPHRLAELRRSLPDDPTVLDVIRAVGPGHAAADRPRSTAQEATSTPLPAPSAPYGPIPAESAVRIQASDGWAGTTAAPPVQATAAHTQPVRHELHIEEWAEFAEIQGRIRQIEASGANAYGRVHEGFNSGRISMDGREVVNYSAFNYLALSQHPRLIAAAKEAVERYGTSCSATPLLCGETPLHHELDAEIASFLGTEAAIVFAGGHATNVATVGHMFGPEDLILHDEWIHDSSVRGAILSGARRRPFPHNDWAALDRLLHAMRGQYRRAVVVIEGAYSQDGDIPDLPRFIEVKKRHNAWLMVDEAHSIGVLGRTGRGIGEHWDVDRADVDLWMGTISKAIGSLGGYIAARQPVIQYLKFTCPLFIFSTGISPANTAAALEAFRVIRDEPERVARVQELSEFFREQARARGLDIGVSRASAVVPVILGSWDRAMWIANWMLERGVNVMPIGYPAVARDQCRLRFFINVDHREADLVRSLDLLGHAMTAESDRHLPPRLPSSDTNGTAVTVGRPAPGAPTAMDSASAARPAPSSSAAPTSRRTADVLVAGASGFIGGHLTRRLAEQGHRVRVLVRENSDRSAFEDLDVEIEVGSLENTDSLRRATAGVSHVYNCAGMSADWGPWESFQQVNVQGSRNLIDAAHAAGTVERFLHVSTTDVYGYPVRPCDESAPIQDIGLPYNRSKVLGEIVVRETAQRTGVPLTVIRPVSVYGPRSKDFVVELAGLLLQKQMVYIRRGDVPAGLLYVENAVDGLIAACNSAQTVGNVYNLRDPETTTWREYMEALAAGLGVGAPSFSLPASVATGVATVSEKAYGALRIKSRPVLTRHAVHLFERDQSYPIDRACTDFGFKSSVSFEEGMRRTLAWLDSAEGRRSTGR
ncbi:aminotransferase class I/II-fold pyridoxal phosphate-dependent enzyme [Streptomyces sp. CG1]|uniref:aminotransferase class I/II-fold pyridoxal phosphate-dependent enzyme n=1 Tax=Streptomyces sp. CG1 TaxID=1287523 RepID=UPI0034E23CAF